MERVGEETGIIPFQEYATTDFGIADFMDNEANLDQFIDLIHGENASDPIANFTSQVFYLDQHNTGNVFSTGHELFDLDEVAMSQVANNISPGSCSAAVNEFDPNDTEERDDNIVVDEEESSETTSNRSGKKHKGDKGDRSRTLISERRRRGRMKEKLYALRALVPYITKMDKASIVGDAVLYVQDLQMQAKKIKSEIAALESSFTGLNRRYQGRAVHTSNKTNATTLHPIFNKIIKMDVFQVDERGFYVRIVSKKEKGVAVFLYKALESHTSFNVQSTNLAADSENYVFTFTLHITPECEVDMNLPSLKMLVASVFVNQGFEFETLS